MKTFQIGDFTISEFSEVDAYCRNSGLLDFKMEELSDFSLESTQEESEITGKGGRVIGKKKKNKKVAGSGTSGLISPGLMRAQTGGEIKYGETRVKRAELKTVSGKRGTIVTDAVAVGTEGAEIGEIKMYGIGGVLVGVYKQGTTVTAETFTYDPATKTITLPDNDEITSGLSALYSYDRVVTATVINNPSDKFSSVRELWVHCEATDKCDVTYAADIYIPRADFKGDFTLDLGGEQTTHNFSFDALPDFCAKGDNDNDFYRVIIYTDDLLSGKDGDANGCGGVPGSITGGIGGGSTGGAGDNFATDDEVRDVFS